MLPHTKRPGKSLVPLLPEMASSWHQDDIKAGNIGHRVAHCVSKDSPFKNGGYELKLMTKAEIKEISASLELYA